MANNAHNEEVSMKNEMNEMFDVVVVGGGASGLVAAITAARNGAKTAILEQNEKTGKKILATGNGKCNYTNEKQEMDCYRGENPAFVMSIFRQFGLKETVAFFEELGLAPKIKNGYYYPASEQASSVAEVLHLEANYLRIKELCDCKFIDISKEDEVFVLQASKGKILSKKVIFATGLLASPKSGSDGSSFGCIEKLGHHFIDVVPALVPLQAKQSFCKTFAGIRADGKATIFVDNIQVAEDRGELQLTDYGVSGIPIFQLSRYATKALKAHKQVHIILDFMPNLSLEAVTELFCRRLWKVEQKKTVLECFVGLFPRKMAEVFLREADIDLGASPKKITKEQIEKIVAKVKALRLDISGSKSFEQAQVCAGGIDTAEIWEDTMESKLVKGLYFAGEVVDIDGMCGGYNLQWAWSSGYVAGLHAAKKE